MGYDEFKACLRGKLYKLLDEKGPFKNIRILAEDDASIK